MSLASVITNRVEAGAARSPDTLHGLLYLVEQGGKKARLAELLCLNEADLDVHLEDARRGEAGRVPPVHYDVGHEAHSERLPGLFSRLWMRELLALMLRPDGVDTDGVSNLLEELGSVRIPADVVSILRKDLRDLGIPMEAKPIGWGSKRCYRIVGRGNARLQKIIANGWSL